MQTSAGSSSRKRSQKGTMSEFALSLIILMLLAAFPLMDLCAVAAGYCVTLLCAHQAASAASTQRRYADSLAVMEQQTDALMSMGLSKFVKLNPVGGYDGTGADLYVDESNFVSGSTQRFGPNKVVQGPLDTASNIYECSVLVTCEVGPFLNMSCVPFLAGVPGLGKPATLTSSASRAAEFPQGLESPATIASSNVVLASYDPTATAASPTGLDGSGWNNPSVYDQIAALGQKVVAQNVVIVHGTDPWVQSGLSVQPGETVWVDSRSDGAWGDTPPGGTYDANGNTTGWNGYIPWQVDGAVSVGTLIACIGPTPNPAPKSGPVTGFDMFAVGKVLTNHAVVGNGGISLMMNDNDRSDNQGLQMVRIIITQ